MKLLLIFLLCNTGFAQTTYKSLASEYIFQDSPSSVAELIERDIFISKKFIIIKSYGREVTDIQTWKIQSKEESIDTISASTIYYVELASGEKYEYPAEFLVQFNSEGKVETIICEIPPLKFQSLPKTAPTSIRFIID